MESCQSAGRGKGTSWFATGDCGCLGPVCNMAQGNHIARTASARLSNNTESSVVPFSLVPSFEYAPAKMNVYVSNDIRLAKRNALRTREDGLFGSVITLHYNPGHRPRINAVSYTKASKCPF